MKNVSKHLKTDGYFLVTAPNSKELLCRLQETLTAEIESKTLVDPEEIRFGNSLFTVTFPVDELTKLYYATIENEKSTEKSTDNDDESLKKSPSQDDVTQKDKPSMSTILSFIASMPLENLVTRCPLGISYDFALKDAVDECPEYLMPIDTLVTLAKKANLDLVLNVPFPEHYDNIRGESQSLELLYRMKVLDRITGQPTLTEEEWEVTGLYSALVFQKQKSSDK